MISLPKPYEDELLYSVLARAVAYLSSPAKWLGRHYFSVFFGPPADELVNVIEGVWGRSVEDVVDRHTMLPFYGRFRSSADVSKCLKAMKSDGKGTVAARLGLQAHTYVRFPTFLRFCRSCALNDFSMYGETFWRRSHQLSGVLVCAIHGETLRVSRAEVVFKKSRLQDATAFVDPDAPECATLARSERVTAHWVATRCIELLRGAQTRWDVVDAHPQYRRAAIACGYAHLTGNPGFVCFRQLVPDFTKLFGEELLIKMGCDVRLVDHCGWLKSMFRLRHTHFHPLLHALVQLFLEERMRKRPISGSSGEVAASSEVGKWKCPNVFALHDDLFRIPMVERRWQSATKKWRFAAVCSCGFGFSFREGAAADPLVPKISKVSMWGPHYVKEVKRLKGDGLSIRSIASRLNMSVETATRLIKGKPSAFERARDDAPIGRLRKKWLKTRSRSVYDKLYNLDRAWLTTAGKAGWCGSTGPKKDWQGLDKTYAPRLRSAIAKLRSESGGKRIFYPALERECGIKNLKAKAARMPRCSRILFNASVGREGGVPPLDSR